MTPFTTRTGLQIGRCYIKPPMPVQGDAVAIQSALLAKGKQYDPDRAVFWTLAAGLVVVILSICFQEVVK